MNTKHPILYGHNPQESIGTADAQQKEGGVVVVLNLNKKGAAAYSKLHNPHRGTKGPYGQVKSPIYAALNQPPKWKRDQQRNDAYMAWGAVIITAALVMGGAYWLGMAHGAKLAADLIEAGR